MTLNEPTAGCYWLVVYSHCHLSVFNRMKLFRFAFSLSCYFAKFLKSSEQFDFFTSLLNDFLIVFSHIFLLNHSELTVSPKWTTKVQIYLSWYWLSAPFHPPFSFLSVHLCLTFQFLAWFVLGGLDRGSTGVVVCGVCVCVCVCVWDKVRVNVWPTQGPGNRSCLQLSD